MTPLGLYLVIMFCLKVAGVGDFSWWWITGPPLALVIFSVGVGIREGIQEHRYRERRGDWSGRV